ncbi:hypothetical protein Bca52824_028846 [Brassica carinata]|uniref:J domain-containing protein n=1 Tax=Brassica carinata TaxID=52824 RepID=A0A8X8AQT9_BRACI|nr:hypothetical protein Bca52824_028846 [Brassica carinata]
MASPEPDQDTVNEAIHHKTLAESSFTSGDLTSALHHARKALTLSPNTEGVSSMVTAFETITTSASSGDTPEWYKILKVEPFSHFDTVKQQYRKLALVLHPDKNPYAGCEEGFKLVKEAYEVLEDKVRRSEYDKKLRIRIASCGETTTFSTVCSGCGSLHKFDRKYLGQSLMMCASCKKSFEAKEDGACSSKIITYSRRKKHVGESMRRAGETRVEEAEAFDAAESLDDGRMMTLAEMQSVLKRNKPENSNKRITKKKTNHKELSEVMNLEHVPRVDRKRALGELNQETYMEDDDLDKERMPRSFKKGQVWAIYDDNVPRSYCVVSEVVSLNPFKVWISWLDFESEKLITWMKNSSSHMTSGRFRVSEKALIEHVKLFSHVVNCERVAREVYQIYPMKGSVWAVYSETDTGHQRRKTRGYEVVVCLTMYSDAYGLSVAYLEKVNDDLFKRRDYGWNAVRWVEKEDVAALLSHQIPAKKLQEDQSGDGVGESWVLDLASVPPDLVSAT